MNAGRVPVTRANARSTAGGEGGQGTGGSGSGFGNYTHRTLFG